VGERGGRRSSPWWIVHRARRQVLPRRFYDRATLEVARDLLGKALVHETVHGTASGLIVEVEAYIGEGDPACHAAAGPTSRNRPLYGPPGHAYVYFNYGVHYLVNAVTEAQGRPAAVLIRALEPFEGVELMLARRRVEGPVLLHQICRGPGRLTRALGITLAQNLADLRGPALRIEDVGIAPARIVWGPRVGIRVGVDRPWRCLVADCRAVSTFRAGTRKAGYGQRAPGYGGSGIQGSDNRRRRT